MSEYLNGLRQGSAKHAVKLEGNTIEVIEVMPRDDSDEALKDFQAVAD